MEHSFASYGQVVAWFEAERASLLSAVHQAPRSGFHSTAWQLADALWTRYSLRSSWADWHDILQVALAAARETRNGQAEAWLMTSLGHMYSEVHQVDKALDFCLRALAIFRKIRDQQGEARALTGLGRGYISLGRFEQSIECEQRALAICQRMGDPYREARALKHLGEAYRALGRFEEALDCLQRALAIRQELGYIWGKYSIFVKLGQVYSDLHRFDEAIDRYQQSLAICRDVGHRWGEARSLQLLGLPLQKTEGVEAARACWAEALQIFTELGALEAEEVRDLLKDRSGALRSNT
jgi:tetratricopeptide (TPR) repeat protein